MKKFFTRIVLLVFLFPLSLGTAQADKLVITGEAWPPFEFMDGINAVGIDIDIATTIFNRLGHEVEFKILPWDKAWKMIEDGKSDASLSTSRKDKRKPFLYYPDEDMWVSEFVFYTRQDNKKSSFSGYDDAKGLKVAVVKGNSYHQSFWDAKLDQVEFETLKEAIQAVADGKADIIPMDKIIGAYSVKDMGLQKKLTFYDKALYSKGYPMPFAKKSSNPNIKKIAEDYEKELKKMKENGEYNEIITNWMMILQQ